jgi:hypothetical protein
LKQLDDRYAKLDKKVDKILKWVVNVYETVGAEMEHELESEGK